jgi:transposase
LSRRAAISSLDLDLEATVAVQAMVIEQLRQANAKLMAANAALGARVAELERRLGKDSSNSSRPPSSDGLGKPPARRRERRRDGRAPGKQPGAPGAHLAQVADPDEVVVHRPVVCEGCGGDLTLAPVTGVEVRQVFDLPRCGCGCVSIGPSGASAPAGRSPPGCSPLRHARRRAMALGSAGWRAI